MDTPRKAKRLFNVYRMVRATRDLSPASRFLGDDQRPGEYQAVVVLLGLLTIDGRLLRQILDNPPDLHNAVAGGLLHRPSNASWREFVADLQPQPTDHGWRNGIVGMVPIEDLPYWSRLHRGLNRVSADITLTAVADFQLWVPTIRRFCYTLATNG